MHCAFNNIYVVLKYAKCFPFKHILYKTDLPVGRHCYLLLNALWVGLHRIQFTVSSALEMASVQPFQFEPQQPERERMKIVNQYLV